jgi:PAS domain S-box-containing protein
MNVYPYECSKSHLSDGCYECTGYKPNEIINNELVSYNSIIKKEYQKSMWEKWNSIVEEEKHFQDEYPIITKSGEEKWVWERGVGVFDSSGKIRFLEGFITDITEKRKIAESRIKLLDEEERRLFELEGLLEGAKSILETNDFYVNSKKIFKHSLKLTDSNIGIMFIIEENSVKDNILLLNSKGLTFGSNKIKTFYIKDIEKNIARIHDAQIKEGFMSEFWNNYISIPCKESEEVLYIPLKLKSRTIGMIGLVNRTKKFTDGDVKIVKAYGELTSLALQNWFMVNTLKENEKMKDKFVSLVSHELRTPLMAITSCVHLLEHDDKLTDKQQEIVTISGNNCKRLSHFINDVLDFQKLKSWNSNFVTQGVHLKTMLDEILDTLMPLVEEKNLKLKNKIPASLPIIEVNNDQITRLFINLIHNAIKYTNNNGSITLFGSYFQKTNKIQIDVVDTGVGIKQSDVKKLFSSFTQLDASFNKPNSSGLGLAIAKNIVKRHNGRIWVDSEVNKGSIFHVELPISQKK